MQTHRIEGEDNFMLQTNIEKAVKFDFYCSCLIAKNKVIKFCTLHLTWIIYNGHLICHSITPQQRLNSEQSTTCIVEHRLTILIDCLEKIDLVDDNFVPLKSRKSWRLLDVKFDRDILLRVSLFWLKVAVFFQPLLRRPLYCGLDLLISC